jgi:hypothetical protein
LEAILTEKSEPGFPQGQGSLGETLLSHALIRMYGREFVGLAIGEIRTKIETRASGTQTHQLAQLLGEKDARLARIYGFSYEGHYYKLYVPSVFVVRGEGIDVQPGDDKIPLDVLGVEYKDSTFSAGVKMWAHDRLDYSIRIDITSGWLEDILLNSELADPINTLTGRSELVARSVAIGRSDLVGRPDGGGRADGGYDLTSRRRR